MNAAGAFHVVDCTGPTNPRQKEVKPGGAERWRGGQAAKHQQMVAAADFTDASRPSLQPTGFPELLETSDGLRNHRNQ